MADTKDSKLTSSVQKDPNFAVICSFLTKYGTLLGLSDVSFDQLEKWIEDTRYVNDSLKELLMKLLKRWKHSVKEDRMHQYLVRFCHTYSEIDAWELESLGFQRCKTPTKLRVLKNLLECQFDHNVKFKEKINMIPSDELRCLPIGRDFMGKAYWFQMDNDLNMRIYCEEQDDVLNETWQVVVADRSELQNLIASLQEQKSHPGEKSRSATPSTIESDVASVEVGGQGASHGACVSEASSDAIPLGALKVLTGAVSKSEDSSSYFGEAESEEKLVRVDVKVEPKEDSDSICSVAGENETSTSCVKVNLENSAAKHETVGLDVKDNELDSEKTLYSTEKQQPAAQAVSNTNSIIAAETGVESIQQVLSDDVSDSASVSDLLQRTDKPQQVCLRTDVDSLTESDSSKADAKAVSVNVGNVDNKPQPSDNNAASCKTSRQPVLSENNCSSITLSADSEHHDQEHIVESSTDLTASSQSKCSSPQRSKKLVSKQGKATSSESCALKTSVKRKRKPLHRIPSSSSEDTAAAAVTESDVSDSLSADSRSHSAGEDEPPTKRKRDKALKTAAERNRKLGRMKAAARALSPKGFTKQKVQQEETTLAQESDDKNSKKASARNCIPDSGDNLIVANNGEAESVEQHLDKPPSVESSHAPSEDCHISTGASVSEHPHDCVAENTTDKTTDVQYVLSAPQDNGTEVNGGEVAGKKECSEADGKYSADKSCEEERTAVKQNTCSTESTVIGISLNANADSEFSGEVADKAVLSANCTEDKSVNDDQSANAETLAENGDGCENRDDVVSSQSNVGKVEDESDKPSDKVESNGHPASTVKKMRGRPRKSCKKGRKKRVHSNVTNAASVTEVQETDYEPTKKLGRPSKKSQLARLAAEAKACDSVSQSEDDIPLIELRRSARANKGQRKLDQPVYEQSKKRNRAKDDEKERKRAEKEEKRRKREIELQEQAALKAKKKKRGKSDSDDDFVPGKKGLSRKMKGRSARKTLVSSDESVTSEASDELYQLFEPESEEDVHASSYSSSEHLDSDGSEYEPRGRNAKRAAAIKAKTAEKADDEQVEDKPCTRCGKSNQPEWILLCDRCDAGYHTACLRPPIMVIPADDWFCPLCEHNMLIEKLQEQLAEFDKKAKLNVRLIQRKERLAYVTVNITNMIQDGERRAASNALVDADLYDDEASGEEESTKPVPTSRSIRKRASQRRRRYSSVSSSFVSSSEDEEELSEVERRRVKRKEVDRLLSDTEENWSYGRRSCRQRKQINYKFEEFDELISGAIEDDVKEQDPTPKPPRHSGKDMANIIGLSELLDDKPVVVKRKKHTRHLTKLDSDETEDDSEEFQLSDADEASTADEDVDNLDEELSDDWSVTRSSRWMTSSRSTRRSNRQRRRPARMNNFVSDDSEENSDNDRSYHRARRAAAKKRVNYHEISDSDAAVSDSEQKSAASRRSKTVKSAKQCHRTKDSDSEYQPSSEAEDTATAGVLPSQTASPCKRLGSSSDESGSEAVSKKKGRLNRIMSSSDYSSSADENPQTDDDKPATLNGDCHELPAVNDRHQEDTDAGDLNAGSENNKGFTIANLLKTSEDRTVRSDNESESSEENDNSGEDSLSGIDDLVDYVTQL